jgi:hypothetical protein
VVYLIWWRRNKLKIEERKEMREEVVAGIRMKCRGKS